MQFYIKIQLLEMSHTGVVIRNGILRMVISPMKNSNLFNLESVYSVDLNDDSIIGLDKNKDNTFNDADFTTLPIEDKGSITMNTDIAGQLYAGSYTNKFHSLVNIL